MEEKKDSKKALIVFQGKKIRRKWRKKEWYFSVVDVISVLTDSPTPRQYWRKIKDREFKNLQMYPIWVQLKLVSNDGKKYLTDCANTEGLFRIIQSIPSKKAEPFKRWLAKVGYDRVQEIENPEIAQKRMREIYRAKGYSDEWIGDIYTINSPTVQATSGSNDFMFYSFFVYISAHFCFSFV